MLKDPYSAIKEVSKVAYEIDKESLKFSFEHTDKFITWIIGFGVAGISLIVANFEQLKLLEFVNIKIVVFFLTSTIFFGLLYRLAAYFYLKKNNDLANYFIGCFGTFNIESVVATDISNVTVEDMLFNLEHDFGVTEDDLIKEGGRLELEAMKKYYLSLIDHAQKKFYIGANWLADTYHTAYKIKKEETINQLEIAFGLKQGNSKIGGFHAKRWVKAMSLFFYATITSFLICDVIVCLQLLYYTKNT